MTKVDLIALGFVALTAFIGWKKGLLASALSVGGIVLGAWLGRKQQAIALAQRQEVREVALTT